MRTTVHLAVFLLFCALALAAGIIGAVVAVACAEDAGEIDAGADEESF